MRLSKSNEWEGQRAAIVVVSDLGYYASFSVGMGRVYLVTYRLPEVSGVVKFCLECKNWTTRRGIIMTIICYADAV